MTVGRRIGRLKIDMEGRILQAEWNDVRSTRSDPPAHLRDLMQTEDPNQTVWRTPDRTVAADAFSFFAEDSQAIEMELVAPLSGDDTHHARGRDDLLRVTTDLVRHDSAGIDHAIVTALGRVGRITGVDRAYIFLLDRERDVAVNTHEWTRAGVEPGITQLLEVPRSQFRWYEEAIEKQGRVLLRDLDEIPEEAREAREILASQGIRSLLGVGMYSGGERVGFVGFDSTRRQMNWSPRSVERLSLVAELFIQSILRARTESALAAANETFHLVQIATNDVIWDWDVPRGRVLRSEALESLLGYPPTEENATAEWWAERVHPDDQERTSKAIDDEHDDFIQGEYRIRHKDGRWVHVLDRGHIVRDATGRRIRIVGMTTDVSDRIQAVEKLRESEVRFRAVVENVSDVIAIVDQTGKILYESPASERVLGETPQQLIGTSVFRSVHPEDRPRVEARFHQALAQNRPVDQLTFRYRHAHGHTIVLETVGVNLISEDSIRGIVLVTRDVSSRRLVEQHLERSNRFASLGHLASAVAHEFNNALMGAQPFLDLIRRTDDPSRIRAAAAGIDDALQKGKAISRSLVQFSRPQSVATERVELRAWLASIDEEIRTLLPEEMPVSIDLGSNDFPVLADPEALHQIVLNIVLWGRDLTESNGKRMKISLRRPDEADALPPLHTDDPVVIATTLRGVSLDSTALEHSFDPMYAAREGRASGLGLAVVKQLVIAMRGDVSIDSRNGTTTLLVCLPALSQEVDAESVEVARERGNSILLIEDDEIVASGISALLEIEGQTVELAETGKEALAKLEQQAPAIVILDLGLPDMSGIEVYEAIKKSHPDLPVIFSSGHGDHRDVQKYLDRPRVEFLLKPYDAGTLLSVVERLLK